MNRVQLPAEFDLPSGHTKIRRDLLVADIEGAPPVRPVWRRPATLVAVAAAVVVGVVAIPLAHGGDNSRVLAYALEPGDSFSYEFEYLQTRNQYRTDSAGEVTPRGELDNAAGGRLNFSVDGGPDPGTFVVTLVPAGRERVAENDIPFPDETNDPARWPRINVVVDAEGRVLDTIEFGGLDGVPGFLLPSASPFSGELTMLPFAFGLPFPSTPLAVGDEWTTEEHQWGCLERPRPDCRVRVGTHRVDRDEVAGGRSTVVIESTYTLYPDAPSWSESTTAVAANTVTAWFDPDEGVLVRIEQAATLDLERVTGDAAGTVMHDEREYSYTAELVDD